MRAERNVRNGFQGASFLQRRFQLEGDGAVEVSVAGVPQPGKSIGKRVGRLAQKWYFRRALSCFLLACSFRRLSERRAALHVLLAFCLHAPSAGFLSVAP